MEIRRIRETDSRAEVSRVYEESWKHAYRGIIPQAYLDAIPQGQWAKKPDADGMRTLVVTDGGHIVGTSSFCRSRFQDTADFGEIVSIYFLPAYMGKGYGKPLLDAAVAELSSMGFRDVFLWVLEENARARRFYEKCGFRCADIYISDEIGGGALREVQYRKNICQDGKICKR